MKWELPVSVSSLNPLHHRVVLYVFLQHFRPWHLASFCAHLPLLLPICRTLIDKDVSIPPETFRKHVDASLTYINRALKQMSRLFLVEDLVDSLKVSVAAAFTHGPLSSHFNLHIMENYSHSTPLLGAVFFYWLVTQHVEGVGLTHTQRKKNLYNSVLRGCLSYVPKYKFWRLVFIEFHSFDFLFVLV